ncbi:MAG: NAD(P)-dependent oxidoreductase [Gammaproteobacteria bacterium]
MQAGFIGLGAMGLPMARNLHRAGLLAGVWNRTREKAEALRRDTGVNCAPAPADLAAGVDVVVTCVAADADLLEVVDRLRPGLRPGTTVVDCSTTSAETAREAAARVAGGGAAFLDAPISGGVEGARDATLAMMVGGDGAVLQRVRPVLEAMAERVVHMGPAGSGQATKAVNQVMAAGLNQAVTEALAFGQALGLDMDKVIEVLGGGAAANRFLSRRGPRILRGEFGSGFRVALHHKDLSICRAMAEGLAAGEARLPLVEMTLVHYRRLMDAGHGDEDISALFRHKQRLFGR